jgi:hypothetical protein
MNNTLKIASAALIVGLILGFAVHLSAAPREDRWHFDHLAIGDGVTWLVRVDRRTGETEVFNQNPTAGNALGWFKVPQK